ncbi:ribonuclease T2 [Rhizoclosmatium globosum]|uniref:ribonuclease T2 n=1 Tax=Rhizoclosmatium globosum TaxID=329046 RepID=A0A1Y2BXU9_9FUNG|nr:ribonuclease T2 [Rhizoclosmatium globosum]|eukprot:ORY39494.1 ribonuclease T2 [Rhizoclosmatium globosum]
MAYSAASCPSYAVGCQLNPITNAKYDGCCVSDSVFVFAQNYTLGLTYKTASPAWAKTSVSSAIGTQFTIHGLWADHCDGTYETTKWINQTAGIANGTNYDLIGCDATRADQNLLGTLSADCSTSYILDAVKPYWKGGDGDDNWLISHEWNKHGTCTGSFGASCYPTLKSAVVAFMDTTLQVYKQLDLATAFKNAGIVPSDTVTYTRAQFQDAHIKAFGAPGAFQCQGNTNGKGKGPQYLSEVWTYLQEVPNKKYVPFDADKVVGPGTTYNGCNATIPIIYAVTANPANTFI